MLLLLSMIIDLLSTMMKALLEYALFWHALLITILIAVSMRKLIIMRKFNGK